jgi:uncharacterized protein YyaL (SSP411 family)
VANRLSTETSPYLLQHAENPVDWWPWSDQALAEARSSDRPIFLSIGYSACHWCHVMAHESFEDPATARLLNTHFVCIKVDREERPDIDAVYMDAAVALTGQGGWPLSVFLTPEAKPFYAGTYFPRQRRSNLPAFGDVLGAIAEAWNTDRQRLQDSSDQLTRHLLRVSPRTPDPAPLEHAILDRAAETLFGGYDWKHGGWGSAPKFPQAQAIEWLLRRHHRTQDKLALEMATDALRRMARGGICDQVGGGFHRYAVDERWLVPHFEKMLYDNALLARAYLHAWQVTGDAELQETCRATLEYLLRDMAHPSGGFFSAEDADSEGEEGRFYLWTPEQVAEVLPDSDDQRLASRALGILPGGNFEGRSIPNRLDGELLQPPLTDETEWQRLSAIRQRLLEARARRTRPARDEKILTDWNGLLLAALAEAAAALQAPDLLEAAQRQASFVLENMVVGGQLQHVWASGESRVPAFLKDHAALAAGLLALYQTDFDGRWLSAAAQLAESILDGFTDPGGGFFDVASTHEALFIRPKEDQDSPVPSGGALATVVLFQLASLTGDPRFEREALSALRSVIPLAGQHPLAFAAWLTAFDLALGPNWQLALVGNPANSDFQALHEEAKRPFYPRLVVCGGLAPPPSLLEGRTPVEGRATAYLCKDFTCNLPTNDAETLREQLASVA